MKKSTKKITNKSTPVRNALQEGSKLWSSVKDGLGAIKNAHRDCFKESVRQDFADSLNLDEEMQDGHEQENRWDYLLGHRPSNKVIGVEPHSAKHDEIETVIKKRNAARQYLNDHLREGIKVEKWLWVASGRVQFANTEKAVLRLNQNGIEFVGKMVTAKHLEQ